MEKVCHPCPKITFDCVGLFTRNFWLKIILKNSLFWHIKALHSHHLFPRYEVSHVWIVSIISLLKIHLRQASLVAQWLRIHLPMQGTRVRSLTREDPTCHGATKPMRHNYWAWALEHASHNYWVHVPQLLKPARLEPVRHNYWARVPQLLKPARLEPVLRNKRSHNNEKPVPRNEKSSPRSPQLEKAPGTATKTQCSQKNKN